MAAGNGGTGLSARIRFLNSRVERLQVKAIRWARRYRRLRKETRISLIARPPRLTAVRKENLALRQLARVSNAELLIETAAIARAERDIARYRLRAGRDGLRTIAIGFPCVCPAACAACIAASSLTEIRRDP